VTPQEYNESNRIEFPKGHQDGAESWGTGENTMTKKNGKATTITTPTPTPKPKVKAKAKKPIPADVQARRDNAVATVHELSAALGGKGIQALQTWLEANKQFGHKNCNIAILAIKVSK
jgi:hypothetical protein